MLHYTSADQSALWLQEHFNAQKPKKTAAQLARQQAALLANVPDDQKGKLDADILNAATGLGMVCNVNFSVLGAACALCTVGRSLTHRSERHVAGLCR